jgi:hypothetical protein
MDSSCRRYWLVLIVCFSLMLLLGCVTFKTALKESGLEISQGQTVYNRVGFRTYGENAIYYSNRYFGGTFIPAGSECTIQDVSKGEITFTFNREQYVLVDWIGDVSAESVKTYFEKFFSKNKSEVGLDKVSPDFRGDIQEGFVKEGMTKHEVLLSIGYPAYLGRKDPTYNHDRELILSHNDWYYFKGRRAKILLRFKGEELHEILD